MYAIVAEIREKEREIKRKKPFANCKFAVEKKGINFTNKLFTLDWHSVVSSMRLLMHVYG